jgi:AraC-like DNA-binding protein
MFAFARARGVDVDAVARSIGVPTAALDDYDRRIPEASRARAWNEAAERSGDPVFGLHTAEHSRVGAYDVLDYALYFSSTLRDALDRIIRFHRVLCDAWAIEVDVTGDEVRVRRIEKTPPHEAEAAFGFLVLRARELTGQALVPHEVRFAHAAPADTAPHAALFCCPVRFGYSASELLFAKSELLLPVRTANTGVGRILDRYMTEVLGRLPRNASFVERVRALVAQTLRGGGRPTLQATAHELHASARTVQRRLGEHGVSYFDVVDSVRRELAERLVGDRQVSVTEAAYLTGFADVSGFRRRYKRWTGRAPSHTRSHR